MEILGFLDLGLLWKFYFGFSFFPFFDFLLKNLVPYL